MSECLTCNDSIVVPFNKPFENSAYIGSSDSCLYYSATFSLSGGYYALECLGEKIPITYLKSSTDKSIECKNNFILTQFSISCDILVEPAPEQMSIPENN